MKTVEYRDVPKLCGELLNEVEAGESFEVIRDGVARVRIVPLSDADRLEWAARRKLERRGKRLADFRSNEVKRV
jgi:antitoxin (DNA-binding transcriptional repressor) of toxin-antitoxin stability system